MNAAVDGITIALGNVVVTDAFGLYVDIGGAPVLHTILATGPGLFRSFAPAADRMAAAGDIVGFLQRGPVLLPMLMPEAGWVLATVPDRARVEHGTPVLRILVSHQDIMP